MPHYFGIKLDRSVIFMLLGIPFLRAIFFVGSKKKEANRLAPAQIHQITRDLAAAGRSAAPSGTEIHTGLQASDSDRQSTDSLDITLFSEGPDGSALPETTRVERSLGAVATRYGLTKMPLLCREGTCFYYVKSGCQTHVIHFRVRPKLAHRSANGAP